MEPGKALQGFISIMTAEDIGQGAIRMKTVDWKVYTERDHDELKCQSLKAISV